MDTNKIKRKDAVPLMKTRALGPSIVDDNEEVKMISSSGEKMQKDIPLMETLEDGNGRAKKVDIKETKMVSSSCVKTQNAIPSTEILEAEAEQEKKEIESTRSKKRKQEIEFQIQVLRNKKKLIENQIDDIDEEETDYSTRISCVIKDGAIPLAKTKRNNNDQKKDKYPADLYSLMAIGGYKVDPIGFWFSIFLLLVQTLLLLLLIFSVLIKQMNIAMVVDDNPSDSFIANIVPANVENITRFTQYVAIFIYCLFRDEGLNDIIIAVEIFPYDKDKGHDGTNNEKERQNMKIACAFRFLQGLLAVSATFLLIITSTTVLNIVLNFTALGFISKLDQTAFELVKEGRFGTHLKKQSEHIENKLLPDCMISNEDTKLKLYWSSVGSVALLMIIFLSLLSILQESDKFWQTEILRVQFDSTRADLGKYNGCYSVDKKVENRKRAVYTSDDRNGKIATFSYCTEEGQWYLYEGHYDNDYCASENYIIYSSETSAFDISTVFDGSWLDITGKPVPLNFVDDESKFDDNTCSQFTNDGKCDSYLNKAGYNYDGGDCCSSTCHNSNCGAGGLTKAFNSDIDSSSLVMYATCLDPTHTPTTIQINSVYVDGVENRVVPPSASLRLTNVSDHEPRKPLLHLDCDDKTVLSIYVDPAMENQTETIMISDGANCSMSIHSTKWQDTNLGNGDIYYVNYTVFHGNKASVDNNPIVIINGDNYNNDDDVNVQFKRIPQCYFDKLSSYINTKTIYTGIKPENKAIDWLMKEKNLDYSPCDDDFFVERYALAVINFAAPINTFLSNPASNETSSESSTNDSLWIQNNKKHCTWEQVFCNENSVTQLNLNMVRGKSILGTIATEIGLLTNLVNLDMNDNSLYGSIPTEIGLWSSLSNIFLRSNLLTGSIPNEIGMMNLTTFYADQNYLSGTISSKIGQMSNLQVFSVSNNSLTGTIPLELGQLENMTKFVVDNNNLTGSVPLEILSSQSIIDLNVYGNMLSDLIVVDGQTICSSTINSTEDADGEHYCNCGTNCFAYSGQRCQCKEAHACCSAYIQQNNISSCDICEQGFETPDVFVQEWDGTCDTVSEYVHSRLDLYGTENQCDSIKIEFHKHGCVCPGYVPL